jgi:hypothetical protein
MMGAPAAAHFAAALAALPPPLIARGKDGSQWVFVPLDRTWRRRLFT